MARILLIAFDPQLLAAFRASCAADDLEVVATTGGVEAVRTLRERGFDAVVTSPATTVQEDLALIQEIRAARPGVRVIVLAHEATPADVLAAMAAHVFACFTAPFDASEIVQMARRAASSEAGTDGIEVLSARPGWLAVRANCHLLTAERLVSFLSQLARDVPDAERDGLMTAFREVLLNAIEHGGGLDPEKVVEVAAVRTERAMVFHVRDPGPGFDIDSLVHAAVAEPDPMVVADRRVELGLRPGGFGLLIARNVVDEMMLNARGNEVLLIKHLT
jgi:anti-sigma regulatory factor (Ser/Thr protein kinase)/CheY-like chemotaxis protein